MLGPPDPITSGTFIAPEASGSSDSPPSAIEMERHLPVPHAGDEVDAVERLAEFDLVDEITGELHTGVGIVDECRNEVVGDRDPGEVVVPLPGARCARRDD